MLGCIILFAGMTLFFYHYFSIGDKEEPQSQKREKAEKAFFSGMR